MHFVYIDDSGDENVRVYSAISIADVNWKESFDCIKDYRRRLKADHGIFVTVEFHATDFVGGRGRIANAVIPKGLRCHIFRETLAMIAGLPGVRLFNAIAPKAQEALIFERLMNRVNTNMLKSGSNAIIVHDEGKDYTRLVRRLGVYNPVPSMYGKWPDGNTLKNIPLDHVLEDIFFRKSHESIFIQMADFCAYALFRSEYPLPSKAKYKLETAFDELHHICEPRCFAKDHRKLGIIRAS
jgi:hypothetical protein